jgi:uncharacterized phiE125 gp8 family phage protein
MQTTLVVPPESEPVTLAEAKRHAQLPADATDDDAYLEHLIRAAREHVEDLTGRAFVTQTRETTWDEWPSNSGPIRLPRAPVQSIVSVGYTDALYAPAVLDPSAYRAVAGTPGRILLPYAGSWPTGSDPVVRYVCGYGEPEAVPESARLCIAALVAHWYERRLPIVTGAIVAETPFHVRALMAQLRWGSYPQ